MRKASTAAPVQNLRQMLEPLEDLKPLPDHAVRHGKRPQRHHPPAEIM
jgi:hypothetical protein